MARINGGKVEREKWKKGRKREKEEIERMEGIPKTWFDLFKGGRKE